MNHDVAYESSPIYISLTFIKSNHKIMNLIDNVELIKAYYIYNHMQDIKISVNCAPLNKS